ncbi:hypothetical protein OSH27_25385, partial [Mycobacterium ulcerans]
PGKTNAPGIARGARSHTGIPGPAITPGATGTTGTTGTRRTNHAATAGAGGTSDSVRTTGTTITTRTTGKLMAHTASPVTTSTTT